MSDMVDRIACVLIDHDWVFSGHCEEHLVVFRPRARAVIEAMREPLANALQIAVAAGNINQRQADAILHAAIDAALTNGEEL